MSICLLDTNAVLFALAQPQRLSARARAAILAGPNLMSVVSYWEVVLKSMKGKLDVGDPRSWWGDALKQLAASTLILRPEHISANCLLPPHHHDPFDRVLIAQAIVEGVPLVTADADMAGYASAGLKIIA